MIVTKFVILPDFLCTRYYHFLCGVDARVELLLAEFEAFLSCTSTTRGPMDKWRP